MGDKAGPETTRLAKDIELILDKTIGITEGQPEAVKALTRLVMAEKNRSYAADMRNGIAIGRKEAVAVMESLKDQADDHHNGFGAVVPLSAIEAAIASWTTLKDKERR